VGSTISGEPRFTTKGDANEIRDPVLVLPEQIRGSLWYAIPFAGWLVIALDGYRQVAVLGAAGLLGLYALWQVIRAAIDYSRKGKRRAAAGSVAAVPVGADSVAAVPLFAECPMPDNTALVGQFLNEPAAVVEPIVVLPEFNNPVPVYENQNWSASGNETTSSKPTMTRMERLGRAKNLVG
jgi:hypothetical protein